MLPSAHSRSLRRELLAWLLLPLIAVVSFNVWTTWNNAREIANLLTDRTLLSSARTIAEGVQESEGVIEAPIPPSALEMFATDDRDHVIYRVNGPHGELVAGYSENLPPPTNRPALPISTLTAPIAMNLFAPLPLLNQ